MERLKETEKGYNTRMVRTIRVCLYRTRMVRKIVPYAYGTYRAIRVRYKIRIWYRTVPLPNFINYRLKSEVSIMLRCRLCSTRYSAIRIKNCLESASAIKIATIKNTEISVSKGSHHMLAPNRHLSLSAKMNGTQRRTLASP